MANSDQTQADLARQLLDVVDATSYVPEAIRAAEIDAAIDELRDAHTGWNNFYTEPAPARRLQQLIGPKGSVPDAVSERYVRALVYVFLTNGHGVALAADPLYRQMIESFDPNQASQALRSFTDKTIARRLQLGLAQPKFKELIEILEPKLTRWVHRDLLAAVQDFAGPPSRMRDDARLRRLIDEAS